VCVHPGGGGVHWYRELSDILERPVLALAHPGGTDPVRAATATADLATRYLRELEEALPAGPFLLFSWCGGSTVTWEMARRLPEERAQVILLDPALEGLAGTESTQLPVLRRCEELFTELASIGPADADGRARALRQELVPLLHIVVDDNRAQPMIGDEPDQGWHGLVTGWRKMAEERLAYRFTPLRRTIQLLVGDELVAGDHVALGQRQYADYLSRWQALATIQVHRVPGDHIGALRPPHVSVLGRTLDELDSLG
jgi:thioesterase domain-containing protein